MFAAFPVTWLALGSASAAHLSGVCGWLLGGRGGLNKASLFFPGLAQPCLGPTLPHRAGTLQAEPGLSVARPVVGEGGAETFGWGSFLSPTVTVSPSDHPATLPSMPGFPLLGTEESLT